MFRHITKAGMDFQDAIFDYMADFIFNEMVPDTYDYTKLFGIWKGKSSKLDLNMLRYIYREKIGMQNSSKHYYQKEWNHLILKTAQRCRAPNSSKNMDENKRNRKNHRNIPSL